ncbi:hypothetical protein CLU79DRAFT_685164, partial [Phycomyces nitens]
MGCCGSKEERDEEDLRAPLLNQEESTNENRMNYQSTETIDAKKEQDFWNEVIERTTQ